MIHSEDKSEGGERIWENGWDAHELQQLRRLAKLSPIEKIEWLEQAHKMVLRLQAQQKNLTASDADSNQPEINPG